MPPSPTSVSRPRQRRKDERPRELLDAALEVFVEKGFSAARIEEVAARAGVSKGTIYLYYPSKEELLKAVVRMALASEIAAAAALAQEHEGDCTVLLTTVLAGWWSRVYDSPASGIFKIMVGEVRGFPEIADFYMREIIEPGNRALAALIQRGIDRGEFRPVDVGAAVHSLTLPMVMLCVHKHSFGACQGCTLDGLDPHDFVRAHIDVVLRGLVAPPAATRARRH